MCCSYCSFEIEEILFFMPFCSKHVLRGFGLAYFMISRSVVFFFFFALSESRSIHLFLLPHCRRRRCRRHSLQVHHCHPFPRFFVGLDLLILWSLDPSFFSFSSRHPNRGQFISFFFLVVVVVVVILRKCIIVILFLASSWVWTCLFYDL